MKTFELNGTEYLFSFDSTSDREVTLYEVKEKIDLHGQQKAVIVAKLHEIIKNNPAINIREDVKDYIERYMTDENKDASQTTNSLGKVLNDYLEGKL